MSYSLFFYVAVNENVNFQIFSINSETLSNYRNVYKHVEHSFKEILLSGINFFCVRTHVQILIIFHIEIYKYMHLF